MLLCRIFQNLKPCLITGGGHFNTHHICSSPASANAKERPSGCKAAFGSSQKDGRGVYLCAFVRRLIKMQPCAHPTSLEDTVAENPCCQGDKQRRFQLLRHLTYSKSLIQLPQATWRSLALSKDTRQLLRCPLGTKPAALQHFK